MKLVGTCIILTEEEAKKVFTGFSSFISMHIDNKRNPLVSAENRKTSAKYVDDNYPILEKYVELVKPDVIEK